MAGNTVIDDVYVLKKELGKGGMATVYLAEVDLSKFDYTTLYSYTQVNGDTHTEKRSKAERMAETLKEQGADLATMRMVLEAQSIPVPGSQVAVKLSAADGDITRFEGEWKNLLCLNHDNVVKVYGGGVYRKRPYYAMEYLADMIQPAKISEEFSIREKVNIIIQSAKGLQYLHDNGIIHRDVKPYNMVTCEVAAGRYLTKITDLGLAKNTEENLDLTKTEAVLGSPYYMSPEQFQSTKNVDFRADTYSLGASLYEYMTGIRPYQNKTSIYQIVQAVSQNEPPIDPQEHIPGLPAALVGIIKCAMDQDIDKRYERIDDLAADLELYLKSENNDLLESTAFYKDSNKDSAAETTEDKYIYIKKSGKNILASKDSAKVIEFDKDDLTEAYNVKIADDSTGKGEKESAQKMKCKHCKSLIDIDENLAGKSADCPVCAGKIAYPASKKKKSAEKNSVLFKCSSCLTTLSVSAELLNQQIKCPKCGKVTPVEAAGQARAGSAGKAAAKRKSKKKNDEDGLKLQQVDEGKKSARNINKKAYLAWAEHEESKKDSYYMAVLRATIYPLQAFGVVFLFTLGIPVVFSLIKVVSSYLLKNYGGEYQVMEYDFAALLSSVVTLFSASLVISVLSSFIFAVMRVTAAGADSVPVIQGSLHRENLASLGAWAALYILPGAAAGFYNAGDEIWKLNLLSIILFVLFLPLGPVAFMMTASSGENWPFRIDKFLKIIEKYFGDYLYLILMISLSAFLFISLGYYVGGKAADSLNSSYTSQRIMGFFLNVLSGCLFVFPVVSFSRMVGMFAKYHKGKNSFWISESFYGKSTFFTKLLMYAGIVVLFFPLYKISSVEAGSGKVARGCKENLKKVSNLCRSDKGFSFPKNKEEYTRRFSKYTVCPFRNEKGGDEFSYNIRSIPGDAHSYFLVIYDKEGNHPDGSRCMLFNNGVVIRAEKVKFEQIMKLQKELELEPGDTGKTKELQRMVIFHH
ncbi:MAG: serine/threonine protein kinase [Planctomycetota bacterium]|jgi:serine/threonine protein kinase